jgi:hypothetical protein
MRASGPEAVAAPGHDVLVLDRLGDLVDQLGGSVDCAHDVSGDSAGGFFPDFFAAAAQLVCVFLFVDGLCELGHLTLGHAQETPVVGVALEMRTETSPDANRSRYRVTFCDRSIVMERPQ